MERVLWGMNLATSSRPSRGREGWVWEGQFYLTSQQSFTAFSYGKSWDMGKGFWNNHCTGLALKQSLEIDVSLLLSFLLKLKQSETFVRTISNR